MKNKIRLAIVGTGYFSQFHYDAWERLNVEVVAICSLNKNEALARSKQFKNCRFFTDFKTMINETDANLVDIIVPPKNHLNFIKIAAESNVNIVCQKPFTNNLKEAKKAVKIAEKYGVTIAVHENFRYQLWYIKIYEILKSSLLGDLFQVSFRMRPGDGQGKDAYLNRQPYFQEMERFMIHETAIHIIDVFRFLFGNINCVFAKLSKLNNHIRGEDAGIVFFEFENGMRGLFDGNRLSDHVAFDRRLTIGEMLIEGSNGTLRLNGDGEIFYRKFSENKEKKIIHKWKNKGFAGDSVFYYQKHLLDYFVYDKKLNNEAKDYIENLKIEDSIYKSNSCARVIKIK